MTEVFSLISNHFDYVMLFFLRVSGLMINSPIFGRKVVPNIAKIGFCLVLTFLFLTSMPSAEISLRYGTLLEYFFLCVKELLFGIALGFVTTTMFNVVFTAGQLIDTQLSFSMASLFDPEYNTQVALSGNLLQTGLMVCFFIADGHLRLIQLLYNTFTLVPVGVVNAPPEIALAAIEVFTVSFTMGVQIALPVIAANMILEICLGALMRTISQLNMFVVGIPLRVILGLVILMISMTMFINLTDPLFDTMFKQIDGMFRIFAGG